jgi:homopolymeric O-antigen transport system ATP-binding protein
MSSEVMISARGLSKAYRIYRRREDRLKELVLRRRYHEDFWAVRDVDLTVARGETVGLIGRNGSGKSTLLQLICGTVRPSRGEVEVRGRVGALLELGAGFNPEFTGRENVWVNAAVLGLSDREIAARFDAIAGFAGIGEYMDQPVKHYSSGMYARLAFSVCAHVDADILVVDEALSVGDGAFQQTCMRFLAEFRRRGTVLFVSHDSSLVTSLCDRVLWLERGAVRASGPAREVCRRYQMALAEDLVQPGAGADDSDRDHPAVSEHVRDARWGDANVIELDDFDPHAPWYGHGGAVIEDAGFYDPGGNRLRAISGGAEVELRIRCRAERLLTRPIIGFILRDRLGQNLAGDNTHLSYWSDPPRVAPGQAFTASFKFQMPYLAAGDYSLAPSVVEGIQADHIHLQWIEDAVWLHAVESPSRRGIVGVPMKEIRLDAR